MDERHYSSWGQVPLTIKGPGQWLGKNESGKGGETEKETVAAERVNINAAGGIRQWQDGGRGERALDSFAGTGF